MTWWVLTGLVLVAIGSGRAAVRRARLQTLRRDAVAGTPCPTHRSEEEGQS
jgi:hypothetical protein